MIMSITWVRNISISSCIAGSEGVVTVAVDVAVADEFKEGLTKVEVAIVVDELGAVADVCDTRVLREDDADCTCEVVSEENTRDDEEPDGTTMP